MDQMMKSTVAAMDAILGGSKLPNAIRVDGTAIREDEPAALWMEYRVNADDVCELVRCWVNFGGADCEISISAFSADRLAEMEAVCQEDWDDVGDHARVRA